MPEGEKIGGASSKEWAESAVEIPNPHIFSLQSRCHMRLASKFATELKLIT